MFNLEKLAQDFAKEKGIELNSFVLGRIRDMQRKNSNMSAEEIITTLSKEEKFSLELKDRHNRERLEDMIKAARK